MCFVEWLKWLFVSLFVYQNTQKFLDNRPFLRAKDEHNFVESVFLLIQFYIKQGRYTEAIGELSNPRLIDLCSQNSILEAEREYFLGIISKNYESDKFLSPLVYFEKVYDLIKPIRYIIPYPLHPPLVRGDTEGSKGVEGD